MDNDTEFQEEGESSEEGSFEEEGEIHSPDTATNLNNSDLDLEIGKALEDGDDERAQILLDEKERRCEELKEEVKREESRESEKRKRESKKWKQGLNH